MEPNYPLKLFHLVPPREALISLLNCIIKYLILKNSFFIPPNFSIFKVTPDFCRPPHCNYSLVSPPRTWKPNISGNKKFPT